MSSDRNFVVWHQILSITEIDFTTETIYVFLLLFYGNFTGSVSINNNFIL